MKKSSVNVAKAEKNDQMIYGANLSIVIIDNQQPSSEKEKVQRLESNFVGIQSLNYPEMVDI